MAKDDDLLPEDQPAENLLPEEKMGGAEPAAPSAAAAAAPVEPPSPIAAELSAKPRSNVWTLLIFIIMASMIAGMYVQLRELNEIYKVNVPIIGQKDGDTVIPAPETTAPQTETPPDAGTAPPSDAAKPPDAAKPAPPEEKPADPAKSK